MKLQILKKFKPPQINQDKANHFIYGFVIFILSSLFLPTYMAFVITFIAALGKEIYDEYDYGGFDLFDLICTILPAIILTIINYIK